MSGFRGPHLVPVVVFAGLAALQVWALERVPLAAYGAEGAPFIVHLQRQYARFHFEQHGLSMFLHPWSTLRALDGHYPALLHLLALPWSWLPGGARDGGFAFAAHLNLVFLVILGWAVGGLARGGWSGPSPAPPALPQIGSEAAAEGPSSDSSPRVTAVAASLALLIPGIFAAARRYYYDLPMTALILGAAALLLGGRGLGSTTRAAGAAIATAGALLIKWAAGLYLAPIWLVILIQALRSTTPRRAFAQGLAALAAATALCLPVALKPDGSFAFERGLGAGGGGVLPADPSMLAGLRFYLEALFSAGLGPGLALALVPAGLLALRSVEGRRVVLFCAVVSLPPLLFLPGWLPKRDGRYLMPMLPWAALVLATGLEAVPRAGKRWAGALLGLVALIQVAWVDGPWPGGSRVAQATEARERWRAWWWTGMRKDVPVAVQMYDELARAVLAFEAGGRVLLVPASASQVGEAAGTAAAGTAPTGMAPAREGPAGMAGSGGGASHAWQYALAVAAPGRTSLVAPPTASSGEAFLEALSREVDVVVASGEAGGPDRLEVWLPALCRCAGEPSSLAEGFRARFPVHRTVTREGLIVNLYARATQAEAP